MSKLKGLAARLRSIVGATTSERRMEEEFNFHVEMEAKRLMAAHGIAHDEARRRALVAFGGRDSHREAMRDGRGARWFDDMGADVRYALRAMRRAPGFAIAVALTLGLGVGMNGVVFGFVDSLLFRQLPAREPQQLVGMYNVDTRTGKPMQVAYEDYLDFRDRSGVFDGLAGSSGVPLNLSVPWSTGSADMVWGEMVTENFFTVLGMRPTIGRFFTPTDGIPGDNPLAVLSYESWTNRFNGDASIVGKRVRINGGGFTVVGVAARGFRGLRTFGFWPEIWVPVGMHNVIQPTVPHRLEGRGGGWLMVVGRMHGGTDRLRTQAAAARFAGQLAQEYPASNAGVSAMLVPAEIGFDDPSFVQPRVLFLSGMLGIFASLVTLAIICANLANLQLARAAARTQEIAIRLSLGCSRGRLTRQLLVESTILALPGALIAAWLIRLSPLVESWLTPKLQFRVGFGGIVDGKTVAFAAIVSLIAVALFGLAPALRSSGSRSLTGLIGARRGATERRQRTRSVLVVSQIAMSVIMLVGATLFVRSLVVARSGDVGFEARDRAMLSMNIGLQSYDPARGKKFYDDVLARVRELPFVASAAWGFPAPFDTYGRGMSLYVDGVRTRAKDGTLTINSSAVSEDIVATLGLRLRAGREFTLGDSVGAPQAMIVSQQLAARLWPGKDPIGQRARRGGASGPEITVIGVVDDVKFSILDERDQMHAYISLRQNYRDWQTLIVHTRGDASAALPHLRGAVSAVDPALPMFGVVTMDHAVDSGFATLRTAAAIAGFFGALALLVSSVGLYTVVASGVSERTREIGVRVALGSTPADVMKFVMKGGARLGVIGLVIGLAGALFVARLMGALLFGLSPTDPVTFALVPGTLAVIVFVATYIPARRAVRMDPIAALRAE